MARLRPTAFMEVLLACGENDRRILELPAREKLCIPGSDGIRLMDPWSVAVDSHDDLLTDLEVTDVSRWAELRCSERIARMAAWDAERAQKACEHAHAAALRKALDEVDQPSVGKV